MTALSDTWALTIRDLLRLWRQPWFIGIVLVQPVIWLLLFGELFERVVDIPGFAGGDYKQYLVPGVLVMTAFFSSGWNGMSMIEDLERGVTDRLLVTPAKRWSLIVGRLGQNTVQALIQSLVIVAHGARDRRDVRGRRRSASQRSCSPPCCSAPRSPRSPTRSRWSTRKEETLIGAVTFLQLPLTFLSTAFMQRELIPDWVASVADYNPVNWAIEAGREAVQGNVDWATVAGYCGLLAAFALACTMLATRAFGAYQAQGIGRRAGEGGQVARATAAPGEPGERGEREALHPARRERRLHLVLELAHEQRQVERPREAAAQRAPLLGEADRGLEHPLHLERGSHLDADERAGVAEVGEVVRHAGGHDDDLAGAGDDALAAHPEAHRAVDDLEALLLLRVNVQRARHAAAGRELEVDRDQLAVGVCRGLAERDPLAACGVLECQSCVGHVGSSQAAWRRSFQTPLAAAAWA